VIDFRELKEALRSLGDEKFDALFVARGQRVAVEPAVGERLRQARLAAGPDDRLFGVLRGRRLGDQRYFLELAEGPQYFQEVWPETEALLCQLAGAPPGRFLDVGTGCGVLAIEAAALGHSAVATDLYPKTIELAKWNAAVNDFGEIDFRLGHLFDPVAEKFDLILTAPHYGRTSDQLRLEVLAAALEHLNPGGRLCLATTLEWEEGLPLGMESLLRPLAERATVKITPIVSREWEWFSYLESGGSVPRLTSRHRFLVEIVHAGSGLSISWPPADSQAKKRVVPLARLTESGVAALVGDDDVARLSRTLTALARSHAVVDEPIPRGLIDGCRLGAQVCVGKGGAAGALVSLDGAVRPCTQGGAVAHISDGLRQLDERLAQLAAEAEARRGCPTCSAKEICSRCLFPAPFDERVYCETVRAHAATLPIFLRLCTIADELGGLLSPVEIDRWPRARGKDSPWPPLTVLWNERDVWLVRDGERHTLWLADGGREIDEPLARLGRLIGDGASRDEIEARVSALPLEPLLERLCELVGADPGAVLARTSK
jgi:SAM-dependent methyltransferase